MEVSTAAGRWVLYRWNLSDIDFTLSPPPDYREETATSNDRVRLLDLVIQAYRSDAVWRPHLPIIATRMHHRIRQTLGSSGAAYLVIERDSELVAVSGVAVSHWTDQNFLTGICVHPRHQRRGLGKFLLGRSLQWLKAHDVLQPQVYTESGSLADRKIYQLYGSMRLADVSYPGTQPPPPSHAYTPIHNRYFDDRVESLGFATSHGYATAGVITPGHYEFSADHEEHVLVLSGTLRVKLPGRDWFEVPTNDAYIVPAGARFEVESETDVAYLCRYFPVGLK